MISAFKDLFAIIDSLVSGGFGWIFFLALVCLLVWMWWKLTVLRNQNKFMAKIKWIFLEVSIEELSERSPKAMEQVFTALHAMRPSLTWGEVLSGKMNLHISCEIVSLGGKVSYIFRVAERYRDLLESAIFAQYPKAEIKEVEDYMRNMPHEFYPDKVDFDFWGTQLNKRNANAYPIRVFTEFEHPEQKTFVDPVANIIEVMSNIEPYELMAYQLVIRAIGNDWKDHVQHLLDELKGVPKKNSAGLFDIIMEIPRVFMDIIVRDLMGINPEAEQKAPTKIKEEPPTLMLHKSDVEKQVIAAIEHGLSKLTFEVKIRLLYLAPKDRFNRRRRSPELVGAFRGFDDINMNGLKPDTGHTWTDLHYYVSKKLEAPIMRQRKLTRMRHMWHYFIGRKIWQGSGETYLNTEELASIFHFPVAPNVRVSQLERVGAVKAAPPPDLPVG
ncbi:MAG: hypothetical protein HYV13_01105 [Candidatus Doudnabacteria bacterium]|nr:hypothetical protein [Candidatus Doudnabacteria bacterium]